MQQIDDLLTKLPLARGAHKTDSGALGLMECAAFVTGERHTAYPACACHAITPVANYVNDIYLPQLRDALARRFLGLAGSRSSDDVTFARFCLLADHAVRTVLPAEMEGRDAELCARLRAAPEITPANCARELALASLHFAGPDCLILDDMVRRQLQSALYLLNLQYYQQAAQEIIFLFTELDAEVDVLPLLDQMLAIGNTAPLEVMDEVAARIAILANRDLPASRRRG
ncbi:MAG: hypothetical protein EOO38_07000 [Cytophagaceae bacterium]|nr:MAG: hypothetical protein EOO38_07000 [Cytophagaceae bacterium]